MQLGYPYLIRLGFFKIQSNPGPVLKCRIRLDGDPETGSCSTLVSMSAVRLFVGSALTISFGVACRGYTFDRSAFNVLFRRA